MNDISNFSGLSGSGASELFQILRDGRARTRTELSEMMGLARSTITLRIEALMTLGLVGFVDDATSTGGRPSSRIALNAGSKVVLGIDIGASHVRVALTDLLGHRLREDGRNIEVSQGPNVVLEAAVELGKELLEASDHALTDLLAVGVGIPGPVEHRTGRPFNPPIMPGWNGFDVPGLLQDHFHVPVLVDNDVNIMALGERNVSWPEVDNMLFVKIATGIGSGLISSGRLQRGADGVAGDIGHIRVHNGSGITCHCGNLDCLEAVASGPAVAKKLNALGLDANSSEDVVALVKSGNAEAVHAVRQAGRDVGEVLSACVSLINPSVIVIGGSMTLTGEHFIAGIREVVYSRAIPVATQHLRIVQSGAGQDAGVLGASMLAIHHAMSPKHIDALVNGLKGD
ncbi:sugar kinase [Arthrobacter sp. MYb211]|uniref:ROK family transcriptional regulator n=1 Tax=unclassified Arthrobacter TaxID=235627 RepID=UPI000CFCF132|nr:MULTISPECIES: ROK family transcriptional regulator [unclassified Arthrobacter]PRA13132.1 sugar kinase [Arthrobacter sp. MYb221]PRC10325.1 sugar kinase [Arthrobacter sp. MYb211]